MNDTINAVYSEAFGLLWKKLKSNAVPTIMPKPHEVQVNKHKGKLNAYKRHDSPKSAVGRTSKDFPNC